MVARRRSARQAADPDAEEVGQRELRDAGMPAFGQLQTYLNVCFRPEADVTS